MNPGVVSRLTPTTLGPYEVRGVLGRGGMGTVYLVWDPSRDEPLALKLLAGLHDPTPLEVERFRREFSLLRSLAHPNLVRVFDSGLIDNQPYYTMERVVGQPLGQLPQFAAPPGPRLWGDQNEQTFGILLQLLEGLEHLHRHGVVHRDLKPANVLVSATGVVKVVDLGVALEQDSQAALTQTGTISGTVEYASPEQLGEGQVDTRTDLYSLGVLLYQLVCGQLPFSGTSPFNVIARVLSQEPVTPRSLHADVPEALEALIMRLLQKEPADRFQSVSEVRSELLALARTMRVTTPGAGPAGEGQRLLFAPRYVPGVEARGAAQGLFAALNRGESRLLLVCSAEGLGKSRMAAELSREALRRGLHVVRVHFSQEETVPYRALLPLIGGQTVSVDPTHATADQKFQFFAAVARALEAAIQGRGGLLVVDDAQWADADSIELLEHLGRHLLDPERSGEPLGMVWLHQPLDPGHRLAAFAARANLSAVCLAPLGEEALETLAASVLGDARIAQELAGQLHRDTGGNPGFTIETIRAMVAGGALQPVGDGWQLVDRVTDLPATLADAYRRRLSSLTAGARAVLPVAAVLGSDFSFEVLARCLDEEAGTVAVAVDELIERGILRQVPGRRQGQLAFTVTQLRQAALAGVPPDEVRRLQGLLVDRLVQAYEGGDRRVVNLLALHARALGNAPLAVRFLLMAAEAATQAHATERAAGLYEQVLALLPDRAEPLDGASLDRLVDALLVAGRYEAAQRACDYGLRTCSDPLSQARLLRGRGTALLFHRDQAQALDCFVEALALLGFPARAGLPLAADLAVQVLGQVRWQVSPLPVPPASVSERDRIALRLMFLLPNTYYMVDRRDRVLFHAHNVLRAFNHAHRAGDAGLLALAYAIYAFALLKVPRLPARLLDRCAARAVSLMEGVDDPALYNEIAGMLGYSQVLLGRVVEARQVLTRCYERSKARGYLRGVGHMGALLALSYWLEGPVSTLARWARLGLDACEAIGDETYASFALGALGLATAMAGRFDEANERLEKGLRRVSDGRLIEPLLVRYAQAHVLTWQGRDDEAIEAWLAIVDGFSALKLDSVPRHRCQCYAAMLLLRRADAASLDQARRLLRDTLSRSPSGRVQAFAQAVRAQLLALEGRQRAALDLHARAMTLHDKHRAPIQAADCRLSMARILERTGQREAARLERRLAEQVLTELGATGLLAGMDDR